MTTPSIPLSLHSLSCALIVLLATLCAGRTFAAGPASDLPPDSVRIVGIEGVVETGRSDTEDWHTATTNQVLRAGDKLRTAKLSRALVQSSVWGTVRIRESSYVIFKDPARPEGRPVINLIRGYFSFFNRDKPIELDLRSGLATAGTFGTEFLVHVPQEGTLVVSVYDGAVELRNPQGTLRITADQSGTVTPGVAPQPYVARLEFWDRIQWCLYYPAVLDGMELALSTPERNALTNSLAAYQTGDVKTALAAYPEGRVPQSDAERVYRAALLLAVGEADQAVALIGPVANDLPTARAIRKLVAVVMRGPIPSGAPSSSSSEWLAESYSLQSQRRLAEAQAAAKEAVRISPLFSFAWARLAELEFSEGRSEAVLKSVEKARTLAPRLAPAWSLEGFAKAAQNHIAAALESFQQALTLDPALPDAWLGRGLCRIRKGDPAAGRADLLIAASLDPQRAGLRSYLGKALADAGEESRAEKELHLARRIDPNDPTTPLYAALLHRQQNRINEAIRDLEESQDLNGNRSIYRSRLLLDQDLAVRSANLARLYEDAGMQEVALREAGRAVSLDYANYSAHLFLANTYDSIRDPSLNQLRLETPTVGEYLMANLLAPVGAGVLSPAISQGEYSKLFEQDRFGFASSSTYLSRGAWEEIGSQFGTFGGSSYSINADYRSDPGQHANNDFKRTTLSAQIHQQLTPNDTLYVEAAHYKGESGDLFQRYDPTQFNDGVRNREWQEPILLVGFNHQWSPESQTIALFGWLNDRYEAMDPNASTVVFGQSQGVPIAVSSTSMNLDAGSALNVYSGEIQQILKQGPHQTVFGLRYQSGDLESHYSLTQLSSVFLGSDPRNGTVRPTLEHLTAYAYHSWEILDELQLIGGLAYDHLTSPVNDRVAPFSDESRNTAQWSPKAGLIWNPKKGTTLRAYYSRSLGGVTLEQSFRLEPTQVAGFNQAFRSLIPESVAGSNGGEHYETGGASFEQKVWNGGYLGLYGQWNHSELNRYVGVFGFDVDTLEDASPYSRAQSMTFNERTIGATFSQLIGDQWALGVRYAFTDTALDTDYPGIGSDVREYDSNGDIKPEGFVSQTSRAADFMDVGLWARFNHSSGLFAHTQGRWLHQVNQRDDAQLMGDSFWDVDLFVGYRFLQRRMEASVGILNLTDQDYRLNPLTVYTELPRSRTFMAKLLISF